MALKEGSRDLSTLYNKVFSDVSTKALRKRVRGTHFWPLCKLDERSVELGSINCEDSIVKSQLSKSEANNLSLHYGKYRLFRSDDRLAE